MSCLHDGNLYLTYLHILKTTSSMFYMYAATIVKKILRQVLLPKKTHKDINANMSYYFPFNRPPHRDESDYVLYNTLSST